MGLESIQVTGKTRLHISGTWARCKARPRLWVLCYEHSWGLLLGRGAFGFWRVGLRLVCTILDFIQHDPGISMLFVSRALTRDGVLGTAVPDLWRGRVICSVLHVISVL